MKADVWLTRDGRELPIREMESRHLFNTSELLRRRAPMRHAEASMSFFGATAILHGEASLDAVEREQNLFEEMSVEEFLLERCQQYATLIEEAKRRGLELLEFDNDRALRISTALVCRALIRRKEEVA